MHDQTTYKIYAEIDKASKYSGLNKDNFTLGLNDLMEQYDKGLFDFSTDFKRNYKPVTIALAKIRIYLKFPKLLAPNSTEAVTRYSVTSAVHDYIEKGCLPSSYPRIQYDKDHDMLLRTATQNSRFYNHSQITNFFSQPQPGPRDIDLTASCNLDDDDLFKTIDEFRQEALENAASEDIPTSEDDFLVDTLNCPNSALDISDIPMSTPFIPIRANA